MALRRAHGNGASALLRVEVKPADEQAKPVPPATPQSDAPLHFRQDGRILDSETAREMGRRGGQAKARRVRLIDSLGLAKIAENATFGPYRDAAEEFVSHHRGELAKQAGGVLGPAPSTMVASAALQLAGSRWAFDRGAATDDPTFMKLGSQLANDSRQNLLAAYELATREAQARKAAQGDHGAPWLSVEKGA